mmetsp:Transcript_22705/g.36070  ORF Transcript_22705/g.36070 Transcript_22705/m.36070 type:complete len:490 (-) Transcript_22705:71-1540(-)
MNLNVKNTFIDAKPSDPADSPLARAASDPTGKHAKNSTPFFTGPQDAPIAEGDDDEDDDEEEDDGLSLGAVRGAPLALREQFEVDTPNATSPTEPSVVKPPDLPAVPEVGGWCVRNTFIETDEHHEDDVLFRSQSAPGGPDGAGRRRPSRPADLSEPALVTPIMEEPKGEIESTLQKAASRKSRIVDDREEDDDEYELVRAGDIKGHGTLTLDNLLSEEDDTLQRLLSGGADSPDALVGAGYPGFGLGMPLPPIPPYGIPPYGMMPGMPPMPPGMSPWFGMMPPMGMRPLGDEPLLADPGTAPPFGFRHAFHRETCNTGAVTPDMRAFTKVHYEGLLSTVTESEVHDKGVQRYLVQFNAGVLSPADGVGFVFNPRLPCPKNIQKIVSIFANAHGRINIRVYDQIIKCQTSIKALEIGEWIELVVDLDNKVATFYVWPSSLVGEPLSTAEVPYGQKLGKRKKDDGKLVDLRSGHLACVVKNTNVTVCLGS